MYICFAEYRINPGDREPYLAFARQLVSVEENVYLYEGTDQPNLFVEVWHAKSAEEAERIKKERCDERSSWRRISDFIAGGAAKLHVWTFKPVDSRGTESVNN
ncbi:hypothetical protein [Paenibacillus arenilitoris]|uniref:NIPSNAP domain-containing protein n=1 Tax=Paenibacillus arenilitoris TaxID=2772299 RepID=A0A927CM03_9BACL|nr:hypothetical protein [Paenibacillus arenilitoris]MBD2868075.1 hypothetical protein [Paenibacillus arenilitoris]